MLCQYSDFLCFLKEETALLHQFLINEEQVCVLGEMATIILPNILEKVLCNISQELASSQLLILWDIWISHFDGASMQHHTRERMLLLKLDYVELHYVQGLVGSRQIIALGLSIQ